MSSLTARILGERQMRRDSKWPKRLRQIDRRLGVRYGNPRLGNFRDPVREIFYIVLSARTNEQLYRHSYQQLMQRFPDLRSLSKARQSTIKQCIGGGGLGEKRSHQVKSIAKKILADFGERPSRPIKDMDPMEAYSYLTSLPGVGPKSALCVMMYSLDFDVFPVDTHIQRIASRIGIIESGLKHFQAQKLVPRQIPDGLSKSLHVRLVSHGRKVCLPTIPKCECCNLRELCGAGRRMSRELSVLD